MPRWLKAGLVAQGVIPSSSTFTRSGTPFLGCRRRGKPERRAPVGEIASEPMTAQRYAQAVEALRQKMGNRTEDSAEYAATPESAPRRSPRGY